VGAGSFRVIDLTDIDGSFDFTLGWTGKQRIQERTSRNADAGVRGGVAVASDPSGGTRNRPITE
jgi:hypothetical protein